MPTKEMPTKEEIQNDSAAEKADNLIDSINTRVSEIKQALRGLETEKAQITREADKQIGEIEVRIGRLNSFLTRMGGGAVVMHNGSSNGSANGKRSTRMSAEALERAKTEAMELAGRHGEDGLRRSDLMESLGISAAQATKILASLSEEKRLNAIGEKAGRHYFLI